MSLDTVNEYAEKMVRGQRATAGDNQWSSQLVTTIKSLGLKPMQVSRYQKLARIPRIVATRRRNESADLHVQLLEMSCRAALRKGALTPVHEPDQRVGIAQRVLRPEP